MTRPWLDSYPQNVPAEIDVDEYASVPDLLRASFARHGAAIAFSNLGARMTFAEVDALSRCFAAYLKGDLGLAKGERLRHRASWAPGMARPMYTSNPPAAPCLMLTVRVTSHPPPAATSGHEVERHCEAE